VPSIHPNERRLRLLTRTRYLTATVAAAALAGTGVLADLAAHNSIRHAPTKTTSGSGSVQPTSPTTTPTGTSGASGTTGTTGTTGNSGTGGSSSNGSSSSASTYTPPVQSYAPAQVSTGAS
jgi:hypothetical protein